MVSRRSFLGTLLTPALSATRGGGTAGMVGTRPAPPSAFPPWPEDNDPAFWDRVRDQFYITPGEAFFNTGTLGATPRPVLERVIEDMRTLQSTITRWDYTANTPNWISGYSPEMPLREKLGKLVNVEGQEIALTQNATFGSNFVANGLSLKSGDEVILTDREHPGAICAWQERAKLDCIVLKLVPIPTPANDPEKLLDLFGQAITSRTRV